MVHSAEGLGCGLRDLRDLKRIRRESEGDFIAFGKEGEGGVKILVSLAIYVVHTTP